MLLAWDIAALLWIMATASTESLKRWVKKRTSLGSPVWAAHLCGPPLFKWKITKSDFSFTPRMFGRWGLASKVSSYSLKVCCLFVKVTISSITIFYLHLQPSMSSCSLPCHISHIFMLYCLLWIRSENLTKGSSNNHTIPKPGRRPLPELSYVGILILDILPPELSLRQLCPWCFVLIV